jgi:hypothetical protein
MALPLSLFMRGETPDPAGDPPITRCPDPAVRRATDDRDIYLISLARL